MTRDEYVRRYAAEMVSRSEVDEDFARESAEAFADTFREDGDYTDPEGDAQTDMSYWDE